MIYYTDSECKTLMMYAFDLLEYVKLKEYDTTRFLLLLSWHITSGCSFAALTSQSEFDSHKLKVLLNVVN